MDEARDLVPVVGAVFQAGPPADALVGVGAVITLLACSPLVILGAVLMISLAVTAMVAAVVVVPVLIVGRVLEVIAARRSAASRSEPARPRRGLSRAPAGVRLATGQRRTP
jgi:hypothetical protein